MFEACDSNAWALWLPLLSLSAALIVALLLDQWLGEPRRWHPLVGFGYWAQWLERSLNSDRRTVSCHPFLTMLSGLLALYVGLLPITLFSIALLAVLPPFWQFLAEIIGLYLCLGWRSLVEHARAIMRALQVNDLPLARQRTGYLVSRDIDTMGETEMSRAATESVLENGNDAVVATLFWFAVGGLPLALLHRLSNTLDAMWGYRNARFQRFGFAAARFDDLLGWLPARLTAGCYLVVGDWRQGLRCWQQQAAEHDSPNAGPVMAAGAGALGVRLGGSARYQGRERWRPGFGCGEIPTSETIERSVALLNRSVVLSVLLLTVAVGLIRAGIDVF